MLDKCLSNKWMEHRGVTESFCLVNWPPARGSLELGEAGDLRLCCSEWSHSCWNSRLPDLAIPGEPVDESEIASWNRPPQTETCTKSYHRLGPGTSYGSDGLEPSPNSDWNLSLQARTQTYSLLIKITHPVSGLTEDQILFVSAQEGIEQRQSDRQEVDLLI